jgi:drug/metabolite transporter (DMT)-like permease
MKNKYLLIHASLFLTAILWGGSWPAGKVIAQATANVPLHAASWQFLIASVVLLTGLVFTQTCLPRVSFKQMLGLALGGFLGVFAYSFFFMKGLNHVPAARAALLVALSPVMTLVLAAVVFGEAISWKIASGMVCSLLGSVVVISHGSLSGLLAGDAVGVGEYLLGGCALSWSLYSILGKKLMQSLSPLVFSTYTSCAGWVFLVIGAAVLEPADSFLAVNVFQALGFEVHSMVVFLGLGATALAYVWYFNGVDVLGAGTAAAYNSLVPAFGVLCSLLYLGEKTEPALWLGGVLTLTGVVIINHAKR